AQQVLRFIEEAQVTGQLDHPGVVPVHELGVDADGRVYFTMRLVKGEELASVFKKVHEGDPEWNQTRALGVLLKVCEAMSHAHEKGVVHRDLKPANVMVGKHGAVYVMDWGLARVKGRDEGHDVRVQERSASLSEFRTDRRDVAQQDDDSPLMTKDGAILGTPFYMPPEQAAGRLEEIGPHSDVYAVGAMLYHLLTGRMPYHTPGDRASAYTILALVMHGAPEAVQELAPGVAPELIAICEKAMARDSNDRYADMGALAEDLRAYLENRVVGAYRTGAVVEFRKWVQRNRALAGALAAAVLAVLIGGIGFAIKADQATEAAAFARGEATRADAKTREAEENLVLAQRSEAEAQAQRVRAEESERLAREETAKVLRLSDVKVLQELESEADGLWPPRPEQIPLLNSWQERAGALLANLPGHGATLTEMRGRALPWSKDERVLDRSTHPRAGELAGMEAELEGLIALLEQGLTGAALDAADERALELEPELVVLRTEVGSRRSWSFDSPQEEWQHDVLAELVGNLSALESGLLAEDATLPELGWSIPKRLAFAQELEAGFATSGEFALRWEKALPLIGDAYPGLTLTAQVGLVPVGADPTSGLWEFWQMQSGTEPERDEAGELVLEEDTGLVFVLLTGGTFWMGAQSSNPAGKNFDKDAQSDEGPVHEVGLSAYFLSKYEMTQGQWQRLTGLNPSRYGPTEVFLGHQHDLTHPVELVSWLDCVAFLPRAGLALPSEAQWEYGARGGTGTIWWTGNERDSLRELNAANLADQAAARGGATWAQIKDWPELDDGFAVHAPVNEYTANGFGLYNVHGNVREWCLDGYDDGFYGRDAVLDPVSPIAASEFRVDRGGDFFFTAAVTRVARRNSSTPTVADNSLGLRPARVITE
ncbi:MAG: sulfatase activating formylglycine-generating enzyme, partial [Planctomycetota bacterium]